jgi:hypothetical protein
VEQKTVTLGGQIATSALSLLIFAGCLVVSFYLKDQQMELLVVGAAIANATTVVNYWLGSSSSSKAKDDTIAATANRPILPVPPPHS